MRVFLGRVWRNLNRRVSRAWLSARVRPSQVKLERLGSQYGGWHVPADAPQGAVAYCGGVGLDATYDFALNDQKQLEVHSFDPTPSSVAYMERENAGRVAFHPWGMMGEDRLVRFYAPVNKAHQSWFTENLHHTSDYFEAECLRMATIMQRLGHKQVYLLKIDIEGSWFSVLIDMLQSGIHPKVLCVEFDSPAPVWRVRRVVRALEAAGYGAVNREGDNVVFLLGG